MLKVFPRTVHWKGEKSGLLLGTLGNENFKTKKIDLVALYGRVWMNTII